MRKCNSVFGHYLGCNGPDTFANGDWAFLKVGFVLPDRILTTSPPHPCDMVRMFSYGSALTHGSTETGSLTWEQPS
uniref:Uncharacterized protein n=1 Tax=Brassica oleracea TaxID=3712 RepID=A0A3P6D0F8_BRAOL|nr:unnamed protein product [Brassica oleracea]